jgi:hypothetical protein
VSLFFLSDDRYWSRYFILWPEKCTSRDFPPVSLWKGEKRIFGGREGRKTHRPSYFFLSQLNLTKPPLSVFSLWKNSPCSVNLEKKLEGAETGWISGGGRAGKRKKREKKNRNRKIRRKKKKKKGEEKEERRRKRRKNNKKKNKK